MFERISMMLEKFIYIFTAVNSISISTVDRP